MKKAARKDSLNLSWDEIGFVCEGLSLAPQPMNLAVKEITEEFSLGPRGAWITILIATTGPIYPLDLAKTFGVGRSLITAELTRLAEAGIIEFQQNAEDGRRTDLKLTPRGETVQRRVKDGMSQLILRRLAAYSREEILLCARMLYDFRVPAGNDAESVSPPYSRDQLKIKRVPASVTYRQRRAKHTK